MLDRSARGDCDLDGNSTVTLGVRVLDDDKAVGGGVRARGDGPLSTRTRSVEGLEATARLSPGLLVIGRDAAVGTADPEVLWRVLAGEVLKEMGLPRGNLPRPGPVVIKGALQHSLALSPLAPRAALWRRCDGFIVQPLAGFLTGEQNSE